MRETLEVWKKNIKLWWYQFLVWVFWPKTEYEADYVDENGKWHLVTFDPRTLRVYTITPNKNDITVGSDEHLEYNVKGTDLNMGWKFDDIKLKSGVTLSAYAVAKHISKTDMQQRARNELMRHAVKEEFNMDKLMDIDVSAFYEGVLQPDEKRELVRFLASRFADLANDMPKVHKVK